MPEIKIEMNIYLPHVNHECQKGHKPSNIHLYYDEQFGRWELLASMDTTIPISFCPFCGEELK